jgi:mycothiol synthase
VDGVASGGVRTRVRVSWRPITAGDVAAWCALLAAAEAVDATGEHYDVDDLLEELADPGLDAAQDTVAAFAGERMVCYGLVRGSAAVRGVHPVYAEGCVHPDHRRTGLGQATLERTAARATELHRRHHAGIPGELLVYTHDGNPGATALVAGAGMRPVRYWFDMHRDLAEPPPPAPLPDGLRLLAFDPTLDEALDEALRLARNDAFAEHWRSVERDESSWRQWFTGSRAFRPQVSFAVLDGDEVAGFLLSYEFDAINAASGVREAWVGQVGTRAPWRGRGVASALLTRALRAYAEAGYQRAGLNVDTANPTGALGLYERWGFGVKQRWTTHSRPL